MMFKKLSLMGLFATAVVGGHITSAYGMEQDPNKMRALKSVWKNFGRAVATAALEMPEVRAAVEPQQLSRWQEKIEHSTVHAEERDFNDSHYHLPITDRELVNDAVTDPEQALISAAAVDSTLETRLTVRNRSLEAAIIEWKKSNNEAYEGLGAFFAYQLQATHFIYRILENSKPTTK